MKAPFAWLDGWDRPLLVNRPLRVIGIDLGTTNSTITEVVWEPGGAAPHAEVIEVAQLTEHGEAVSDVVPSVVALHEGRTLVGQGAYRLRGDSESRRNKTVFWECKNEIGTRRTYHQAPEGFRTPKEIAGHLLRFLHEAALDHAAGAIDRVVVTVPASFQVTQRRDTLQAAELAGLDVQGGDLLDEPVAAFLDFMVTNGSSALRDTDTPQVVLVLDFGGGTCDVAILEVTAKAGAAMGIARLAVSRFHRIGGSDIDDVLAYEILLPRLFAQNGRKDTAFPFTQKRDYLLPALSSLAQQLKIKLSDRIAQLQGLGSYDPADGSLAVSLPGTHHIPTGPGKPSLSLSNLSLSVAEFRKATQTFLSRWHALGKETEYTSATSIFAPVSDALSRAGYAPLDVDAVLLVGGSSLLPPFVDAVEDYFPDAEILRYRERRDALRCVGRGAAYHALLLAAYGSSPLTPTTGEALGVRYRGGVKEIVARNAALPYPAGGSARVTGLRMQQGAEQGTAPLLLEFLAGANAPVDGLLEAEEPGVVLRSYVADITGPVRVGDPITLDVSVDENQVVSIEATVRKSDGSEQVERLELDNPFSAVENPGADLEALLELEERAPTLPQAQRLDAVVEMARLCTKLGQPERARELYERSVKGVKDPHRRAVILNELGILCGKLHDRAAEKAYLIESARVGNWSGALFNLALRLRHDDPEDALELLDTAIEQEDDPAYHVLRAQVLRDLDRGDESERELATVMRRAERMPPSSMSTYLLSWMAHGASLAGRDDLERDLTAERKRRRGKDESSAAAGDRTTRMLPTMGEA